jgi:hypothetical protein
MSRSAARALGPRARGRSLEPPPVGGGEGTALSHRAEIFRSKLIEDFQILESTSEQGKRKVPIYSTTDIIGN